MAVPAAQVQAVLDMSNLTAFDEISLLVYFNAFEFVIRSFCRGLSLCEQ